MEFKDLYTTVNQYAEKHGLKPASVALWVEKAKKEDGLQPYTTFGNVNVYAVADLAEARIKYERKPAQPKVHPDQHREVVERAERLAVENAELTAKLQELMANYNGALAELSALQKIEVQADEFAESVISG